MLGIQEYVIQRPLLEAHSGGGTRHTPRKTTQIQTRLIPKIVPLTVGIHGSALPMSEQSVILSFKAHRLAWETDRKHGQHQTTWKAAQNDGHDGEEAHVP